METAALSLESLGRGFMGILILIFIAYALSANRRAIQWKTVGLGLGVQLIIAIGVLKIGWVTAIFETMGNFFVNVLEYTGAGTAMLLGEFANVDRYGFIFLFQALPVIIFFLALEMILGIQLYRDESSETASIVPIAFPLLAGAGTLTSILSLRAEYDVMNIIIAIIVNIIVVFLLVVVVLLHVGHELFLPLLLSMLIMDDSRRCCPLR